MVRLLVFGQWMKKEGRMGNEKKREKNPKVSVVLKKKEKGKKKKTEKKKKQKKKEKEKKGKMEKRKKGKRKGKGQGRTLSDFSKVEKKSFPFEKEERRKNNKKGKKKAPPDWFSVPKNFLGDPARKVQGFSDAIPPQPCEQRRTVDYLWLFSINGLLR